jgi:hypothetical protein
MGLLDDLGYYASQAGPGVTQGLLQGRQEQINLGEAQKQRDIQQDYNNIQRQRVQWENPSRLKAFTNYNALVEDQPGFEARVNAGNLSSAEKQQIIAERHRLIDANGKMAFQNDPTGLLGLYSNGQVHENGDVSHSPEVHQRLQDSGIDTGTPPPPGVNATPAAVPTALTQPSTRPLTMANVGLRDQIQKSISPGSLHPGPGPRAATPDGAALAAGSPGAPSDVNALLNAPESTGSDQSLATLPEIMAGLALVNADGTVQQDAPAGTVLPGGPQITHDQNGVPVLSKPQFAPVPVPTYNQLITMANSLPEVGIAKNRWDTLKARNDALRDRGIVPTKEEIDGEDKASQAYIAAVKDGIDHVAKLAQVPSDINKAAASTWESVATGVKAQQDAIVAGKKVGPEITELQAKTEEEKARAALQRKQTGVIESDAQSRYNEAQAALQNARTNQANAKTNADRLTWQRHVDGATIDLNKAKLRLDSDKFLNAPGMEESKRFIDKQIDQFVNGSKYSWKQGQGITGGGSVSLGPGFKIAGGSIRTGYRYSNSGGGVLHPVGTAIGLATNGFPSAVDLLIGYSKAGVGTPGGIDYPLPEPATITDPKGIKTSLTQREILFGAAWAQAAPDIQKQILKKAGSPGYPSIGKMRLMMKVGSSWLSGAESRHPGINPADENGTLGSGSTSPAGTAPPPGDVGGNVKRALDAPFQNPTLQKIDRYLGLQPLTPLK